MCYIESMRIPLLIIVASMLYSAGLAQAEPEAGLTRIATAKSPDGTVHITWYVTAEEAREIREIDPVNFESAAQKVAYSGFVEPTCTVVFATGKTRRTIRPARCSVIFEPFSPDGKWAVFQRGSRWDKLEVVPLNQLRAFVLGTVTADYAVQARPASNTASVRKMLSWIGARGLVFTSACCGYTQLFSFDLRSREIERLGIVYGSTALWYESPGGKWIAIGRELKSTGAPSGRVDLVAVKHLASYLFENKAPAASAEYRGRLRPNPAWPTLDQFSIEVVGPNNSAVTVSVSASQ